MKELIEQLTAREKKLLYFLFCFLIVVGGWFLFITPQLDKVNELNIEYQMQLTEHSNKQLELVKAQSAPELLEEKKAQFEEILSQYGSELKDEEIDRLITHLILNQGLKPVSLQIGEMRDSQMNIVSEDNEETTLTTPYIKQIDVYVMAEGSYYQFKETIDALNKLQGVEITDFYYELSDSNEEDPVGSFQMMLYMR